MFFSNCTQLVYMDVKYIYIPPIWNKNDVFDYPLFEILNVQKYLTNKIQLFLHLFSEIEIHENIKRHPN